MYGRIDECISVFWLFSTLDKLSFEDLAPKDILRFISEGAKLERETRRESTAVSAKAAGNDGASSLAETIISAYKRRMEGGNDV